VKLKREKYQILHCVSSLHIGGVGHLLLRNLTYMSSEVFQQHVCYLVPQHDLLPTYRAAGFSPHFVDHRRKTHGLRTLLRLVRLVRMLDIDLIHTNLMLDRAYCGLVAMLCRVPLVVTLHAADAPIPKAMERGSVQAWAKARLEDGLARWQAQRFVAVSSTVRDFQSLRRSVPKERIDVVDSGISLENLRYEAGDEHTRARLRQRLGIAAAFPVLINVARLVRSKGQHHLLPMMQQVRREWPSAKLLLVGGGAEQAALSDVVAREGLEDCVLLLGQRGDVPALLGVADLFVFPSLHEGVGLAVVEAMAMGLPVVASDIPALREVVQHEVSGLLVSPDQPIALAQGVLEILSLPDRGQQMGEHGRRLASQRHDIRDSVQALEKVYLSILSADAEAGSGRFQ
jgi:glycosyltransferase involved in cell wall biosynthesis